MLESERLERIKQIDRLITANWNEIREAIVKECVR